MPVHVHSFGGFSVTVSENFHPPNNSALGQFHKEPIIKVWQDLLVDVLCQSVDAHLKLVFSKVGVDLLSYVLIPKETSYFLCFMCSDMGMAPECRKALAQFRIAFA